MFCSKVVLIRTHFFPESFVRINVTFAKKSVNYKRIIKILVSIAVLFSMLVCFAFPFNQTASKVSLHCDGESQVASFATPFENALLSNHPVSAPAPSLTILSGGSSGNGFNNKLFYQPFLCDACSVISFFNFYLKETTQCVWQPAQLHLALCVLRI